MDVSMKILLTAPTTTELSVKSVFKERFDIPELVTDDVDENEKELQFILDSFSKFASNPDHVYQALRSEFLYGNNFSALLPHLMRYFFRHDPKSNKIDEISVLLKTQVWLHLSWSAWTVWKFWPYYQFDFLEIISSFSIFKSTFC